MNTKKALVSIIILLLIVNISLGIYIISIGSDRSDNISTDYVMSVLQQREISLESGIPEYDINPSTAALGGNKFSEQSIELIEEKLNGDVKIDDTTGMLIYRNTGYEENQSIENSRLQAENTAGEFIESVGLNRDDFVLDSAVEKAAGLYKLRFVYTDNSGNYFFDIFIDMEVGSGGVTRADIMYRDIENRRSMGEEGISIGTVLMANITRREEGSATIQSISSGYKIKDPQGETAVMSWRIRFADGTERYFEAGSGLEID